MPSLTISLGRAPSWYLLPASSSSINSQSSQHSSHRSISISSSMAPSTPVVAALLLFLLGFCFVDSRSVYDHHHRSVVANGRWLLQAAPAVTIDCGAKCSVRCSKSWKRKMCNKLCGVCCSKCNCVPPGTSAETRAMCPCYATMTNPRGKLKCP